MDNKLILEFIELYKNEPMLWDTSHPLYKNRNEVRDAWQRIASNISVETSIIDLKKKKETLMTQYRHLKRKKCMDESGYQPTWFAFDAMESFLGSRYDFSTDTYNGSLGFVNVTDEQYSELEYLEDSDTSEHIIHEPKPKRPAKRESSAKHIRSPVDLTKVRKESEYERDECELYGQLLVTKLRKLKSHERCVIMNKIDNLMFAATMNSTGHCTKLFEAKIEPAALQGDDSDEDIKVRDADDTCF